MIPDHQDWGDPCWHREAWEGVRTHTRTVNGVGPDHCHECSEAVQEWVQYPCDRAASRRPKWVDLFGLDPDFTGGQDVNAYLDESRGDA